MRSLARSRARNRGVSSSPSTCLPLPFHLPSSLTYSATPSSSSRARTPISSPSRAEATWDRRAARFLGTLLSALTLVKLIAVDVDLFLVGLESDGAVTEKRAEVEADGRLSSELLVEPR